jgi:hypothetical protein
MRKRHQESDTDDRSIEFVSVCKHVMHPTVAIVAPE